MARHVGRPTNEEVAARKRKQMLKIMIPGGLVALVVIMIVGSTGLRGLMGASINYCNSGDGDPDSDNMCTSKMDARLLGDVNGDSKITQADADLIKSANFESTSIDFAAADVNKDKLVNINDATVIENFLNGANTTNTATGGTIDNITGSAAISSESALAWNEEYVCPVDYSLDGTTCIKKYDAFTKEVSEETTKQKKEEMPIQNNEKTQGDYSGAVTENYSDNFGTVCTFNNVIKKYECLSREVITSEEKYYDTDSSDDIDEDQSNETIDLEENEEVSYVEKESNYLNYADSNDNDFKGKILIHINDKENNLLVSDKFEFQLYKNSQCTESLNQWPFSNDYSNDVVMTAEIGQNKISYKKAPIAVIKTQSFYTDTYIQEKFKEAGKADIYLKVTNQNSNYTVSKNCQKVTLEKEPTKYAEVTFEYINKKYATLSIDYNNVSSDDKTDKKVKKIPVGANFMVQISPNSKLLTGIDGKTKGKKYFLAGFNLLKGKKYLCYNTSSHNPDDYTWNQNCSHGKILISPAKVDSYVDVGKYIKDDSKYTLKLVFKTDKITIKLKNSKDNKAYQRHAILQLYSDKNGCLNKTVNKQVGAVKPQLPLAEYTQNNGVLILGNKLELGKTYYLRIDISKFYIQNNTLSTQCVPIKATTKTKVIKLNPKTFIVKYTGGKDAKGSVSSQTKYTDVHITLKKNNFTRSGYKFDYWYASRTVTIDGKKVTQYRGFTSKGKNRTAVWTTKDNCDKYGYVEYKSGGTMNVNTFEGDITMHAKWKKK